MYVGVCHKIAEEEEIEDFKTQEELGVSHAKTVPWGRVGMDVSVSPWDVSVKQPARLGSQVHNVTGTSLTINVPQLRSSGEIVLMRDLLDKVVCGHVCGHCLDKAVCGHVCGGGCNPPRAATFSWQGILDCMRAEKAG